MSFLGSNPTTSASAFGTASPSTGFSFGSGDAKSVFGSPSTDTKSAFNFTSPTSSNPPAFGGFAFGAKTTAAAPSSLFTSPTTTNATSAFGTKPLNFSGFTSPPNQTVGSPGFGQPTAQQQPQQQNLSFGATTQQAAVPAFSTPAPNTQASTGMFGGNTSSLLKPGGTGFGFQTPASGFSSVQQPVTATTASAPQTTQSGLSFGAATTTASNQFAFGAKTGFSFGQTSAAAAPAATSNAAPTSAFSFATGNQQQTTAPAQPQSTLNFSSPTPNLNFGGAQTTAPPSFGTTSLGSINQNQPLPQPVATQSSLNFSTSQAPNFSTSQPQPQASLSLGLSQASSLSFPKAVTSTPTTSLNFTSQPSTTQTISFGAPQTTANLSFGTTAASTQSQPLSFPTVSMVQSSLPQTSLSFGTSTAQSTAGLNFGTSTSLSFGKPAMSATTTAAVLPTSAASKPATGFGFPGTSSALPLSTASSTTTSGITTLGQAATSAAMPALSTATTTTAPAVPAQITSLTFAQLEENINKWTIELEEQEKTFINQATQINAWDRLLISNGEKIVELNDSVQTVKNEQQSLDHELDFIVAQQKELQDLLAPLEKQLLENTNDRMRDPEREHMYNLAENLDTQLRQMSEDLKEVIEHLNETNRSQDSNDPIVQIGRILNAHMSSMQWIDTSIAQITTKLDQLKATHDTLRRDNERSFQLTYN